MKDLRTTIEMRVRSIVASSEPGGPMLDDPGDEGLFGPAAACWTVHGDFPSMMIGGVTALLMQMLHPSALAGVWDHSNFREDMGGRLRRTAGFIAWTTFGPTEAALARIERVTTIHEQVRGRTPDGRPYAATDPRLLTWVHVCEVSSFLAASLRYRQPMPPAEQDRYFAETAEIARRLGARDVPTSRVAVADYFRAIRAELKADARTREVAQAILSAQPQGFVGEKVGRLFMDAAVDLLPDWARSMHGLHVPTHRRVQAAVAVPAAARVMRWSLRNNAETRARRRVASLDAG